MKIESSGFWTSGELKPKNTLEGNKHLETIKQTRQTSTVTAMLTRVEEPTGSSVEDHRTRANIALVLLHH